MFPLIKEQEKEDFIVEYNVTSISSVRKEVTTSVKKDDVINEENKVLQQFIKEVKIPGFRKGKVPSSIIKSRFSSDLEQQVDKELANQAFDHIQNKEKFDLFSLVKFDVNNDDSGDKKITFIVDLKPTFELVDYKNLNIDEPEVTVSEEDIDNAIKNIQNQHAEYNPVERAVSSGDFVRLEYTGRFEDGQLVADVVKNQPRLGTQKNTWEEAGDTGEMSIHALSAGIIGMNIDEEKDIDMHFPADFPVEEMKEKTVTYHVKIFEVREKVTPELDNQLFEKLKVKDIDELKAKVTEQIQLQKLQNIRFAQREEVVQKLIDSATFDVPESAVHYEQLQLLQTIYRQPMRWDMTPEMMKDRHQELVEETKEVAVDKAKTNFILEKVAEKENIRINEQEMSQMIMQEAALLRISPDELVGELKGNRERIEDLRRRAIFGKTLDFILMSNLHKHPEQISNDSASSDGAHAQESTDTDKK